MSRVLGIFASGEDDATFVPYVVRHPVSQGYTLPSEFSVRRFRGLLACQVVEREDATATTAQSFWQSRASFLEQQSRYEDALRVRSTAVGEFEREVKAKKKAWVKHLNFLYQLLLHSLAVLGAVSAIHTYYGSLFALPDVAMEYAEESTRAVEGGTLKLSCTYKNTHRLGGCGVQIVKPTVFEESGQPSDGILLDWNGIRRFPQIDIGKSETLAIRGRAIRAGRYKLVIQSTRTMGLLRKSVPAHDEIPLEVWPETEIARERRIWPDGHRCRIDGSLKLGETFPGGLRGEATILGVAGVVLTNVYWRSGPVEIDRVPLRDVPGDEASTIIWQTGPEEPFGPAIGFSLLLESPKAERSAEEWREIAKKVQVAPFTKRE